MWFLVVGLVIVGVLVLTGVISHPDHRALPRQLP